MSYKYGVEREKLFTQDGVRMLLRIRDNIKNAFIKTGCITIGNAIDNCGGGDSWMMLAGVDYLKEIEEIRVINNGMSQHGIIVPYHN